MVNVIRVIALSAVLILPEGWQTIAP